MFCPYIGANVYDVREKNHVLVAKKLNKDGIPTVLAPVNNLENKVRQGVLQYVHGPFTWKTVTSIIHPATLHTAISHA